MNSRTMAAAGIAVAALMATAPSVTAQTVTLFQEDFESLAPSLGPIVTFDSELRDDMAWIGPQEAFDAGELSGWSVDDTGVPTVGNVNSGVVEFEGWSFVDRDWWVATAGDQDRAQFIDGIGVVAVADPDEWDDFGTPSPSSLGDFDARLSTPSIDLTGAPLGEDVKVFFNSSWRPEVDQKATLTATFNDGSNTSYELLRYESQSTLENDDPNPFFKDDAPNEAVEIAFVDNSGSGGEDFSIPAGATEVQLEFRLFDAGNNWWWAFDNLQVFTGDAPAGSGALTVEIDRFTNNVKVVNNSTEAVDLRGYSITSEAGVFDEASANFLAPTNNWITATQLGDEPNDLSELNLLSDTLDPAEEIDLGAVWRRYFEEGGDVDFEYLVAGNDAPIPGNVVFVNSDTTPDSPFETPFDFLDLNFDGAIDIDDWLAFKEGFGKSLTDKTAAEAYALGDLNGDGRHTPEDFLVFQGTFDLENGAGAFEAALATLATPEPTSAVLTLLCGVGLVTLRRRAASVAAVFALAFFGLGGSASAQLTLYFEDFDGGNADISGVYGPFQEEDVAGQEVWSNSFPGWTTDNSGVPGVGIPDIPGVSEEDGDDPTTDSDSDGVSDWAGWAFVDKSAWIEADDQGRSTFTRSTGYLMVADNDEWDDADSGLRDPLASDPTPDDLYDVFATTPVINIPAGIPAGRITLSFDSSWRGNEFQDDLDGDNNETALINAIWNTGTVSDVFRRESDPESDFFNPNLENERVSQIDLEYDGVATELQLEFGMTDAWNDWWWGVDNIFVGVPSNPLKLRIDPVDGDAELVGDDTIATSIQFLQVESEGGQLTGDQATGLSGADLPAEDGPDPGVTPATSPVSSGKASPTPPPRTSCSPRRSCSAAPRSTIPSRSTSGSSSTRRRPRGTATFSSSTPSTQETSSWESWSTVPSPIRTPSCSAMPTATATWTATT